MQPRLTQAYSSLINGVPSPLNDQPGAEGIEGHPAGVRASSDQNLTIEALGWQGRGGGGQETPQ